MTVPGSDLTSRNSADLATRARRRRAQFGSLEEARSHFGGRGQFAEFAPEAFEAFLAGAFAESSDGTVRLACDPEDEARMYEAALAHNAWELLPRVRCPARVLGGGRSRAVPPSELAQFAPRLPVVEMTVVPSLTHFGPFEAPGTVADDISRWASSP
jgi:pimeloyl-ACP methyl ester carboxylesterase